MALLHLLLLPSSSSAPALPSSSSTSTAATPSPPPPLRTPPLLYRTTFSKCSGLRIYLPAKITPIPPPRMCDGRATPVIVSEQQLGTVTKAGVVTDQTWRNLVLESDIPVLVDFWAPWCGPCRMIAPIVDQLAVKYAGKLTCLTLNTDESPNIATEYGIRSIPTVMIFKRGEKRDTIIGAVPKDSLIATVEKYLN